MATNTTLLLQGGPASNISRAGDSASEVPNSADGLEAGGACGSATQAEHSKGQRMRPAPSPECVSSAAGGAAPPHAPGPDAGATASSGRIQPSPSAGGVSALGGSAAPLTAAGGSSLAFLVPPSPFVQPVLGDGSTFGNVLQHGLAAGEPAQTRGDGVDEHLAAPQASSEQDSQHSAPGGSGSDAEAGTGAAANRVPQQVDVQAPRQLALRSEDLVYTLDVTGRSVLLGWGAYGLVSCPQLETPAVCCLETLPSACLRCVAMQITCSV